tara:strand:- start:231 stop:1781 length:1551 start_codon:yes stop_codon:yes gene_type:complete
MKLTRPVSTLLILFPSISYIPVLIEIIKGFHLGGIKILYFFTSAAIKPSLNLEVLRSAWDGMQITMATALTSWIISMVIGTFLGVLTTDLFWGNIPSLSYLGKILKYLLAIPRSIHEVIWGLLLLQVLGLNIWVAIISIVIPYSSLTARVISEQLDSLDRKNLIAIKQSGANFMTTLITILLPKLIPVISIYGSYRLECAIRGVTLLGIFGLGGIGTELYLSLKSFEFKEMWTCLWMLLLVMILLEKFLRFIRIHLFENINFIDSFFLTILIFPLSLFVGLTWLYRLDFDIFKLLNISSIALPSFAELINTIQILPLINLIAKTILITFLASGIAISTPPLLLILFPDKLSLKIQNLIWIFFRLIPPPLTIILILLFSNPNISVAALSLGITHMGVMGRLLTDNIMSQEKSTYFALRRNGSCKKAATIFGILTPQSNSYLAYGAYRFDLILKETIIIGAVGGVGLGWQLQESLSSFAWDQVMIITLTFSLLTISGEFLFNISQNYLLENSKSNYVG